MQAKHRQLSLLLLCQVNHSLKCLSLWVLATRHPKSVLCSCCFHGAQAPAHHPQIMLACIIIASCETPSMQVASRA